MRLIALTVAQYSCFRYMGTQTQIYCKQTKKWVKYASGKQTTKMDRTIKRPPIEGNSSVAKKEMRDDCRRNEMGIQMLSAPMYEQVFRNTFPKTIETDTIDR